MANYSKFFWSRDVNWYCFQMGVHFFCSQKEVTKSKLQSQVSSADLFGDDEELSSDEEEVRIM